jgi:hypothetical protein
MNVLLSYLVKSRARRDLMRILWLERAEGSVSDLARRARVSFAAAHRELEAMRAEGLASSERVGPTLAYRANRTHPQSALVGRLLKEGTAAAGTPPAEAERVRGWLAAAGAPLLVSHRVSARMPGLERVLAQALTLAHDDATVARVLPLVFWAQRDRLDTARLVREATRLNERQTLGFFLELTGRLARDHRFASLSNRLHDRRRSRVRPFFSRSHGRMALAAARRKTPRLARRWGYLMNMGLDSFASAFAKYTQVA